MAGFKTHIGTSTVLGVGYGVTGYLCGAPLPTCMLAGGLCSVSGMLPDIDSGSGVPLRESMAFAAAVVPMLMIDRFQHMGMSHESIALAGMLIYVAIRFGVAEIIRRYTVHRGMWHSLPAAAIVGFLAFLICSCEDMSLRLFKAGAVVLGFMSHLVLDEIWSIEFRGGAIHLKKSFGTALKLWSKSRWANISTYAKLVALLAWAYYDPMLMDKLGFHEHHVPQTAQKRIGELIEHGEKLLR